MQSSQMSAASSKRGYRSGPHGRAVQDVGVTGSEGTEKASLKHFSWRFQRSSRAEDDVGTEVMDRVTHQMRMSHED